MVQYIYVDEQSRVLGITDMECGVEVDTEINCSQALTDDGFAKYKYCDGIVSERTEEEIQEDRDNEPVYVDPILDKLDTLDAQVTYTAMMTDTLIVEE